MKNRNRRGVSQVISALFMLAIVSSAGSVILVNGIQSVNTFNIALTFFGIEEQESIQERAVIEHVRFDPDSTSVEVWVRNTGTVSLTIDKVTMVKIDTQDLIINDLVITNQIHEKEVIKLTPTVLTLSVDSGEDQEWGSNHSNGSALEDSKYRITVTTVNGRSFDSVVEPFNT